MSQQYPQQQPGWGAPPPQPPKKRSVGKTVGVGCLGIIGLFVVIGIIAAVASSGSGKTSSSGTSSSTAATGGGKAKTGGAKADKAADTAVFKVWGTAPAGDLGSLDINYGSDSDSRKGAFKNGTFTETLPVAKGAMYEQINAQLQGSGDIHCSVTIGGKTKAGHASGGYNICSAQLSSGLGGGWE